jgi:hypothetical protein
MPSGGVPQDSSGQRLLEKGKISANEVIKNFGTI